MKNVSFIYLLIAFIFFSCSSIKTLRFKAGTYFSAGKSSEYEITVPRGYQRVARNVEFDSEVLRIYYPDSSVLYVSSDITFSTSLNKLNFARCSNADTGYKCPEGSQDGGLRWKEIVEKNLVLGYINVPENRKKEFDEAVASLKIRKN